MTTAVVACGALALHVSAIAERRGWSVDVHPLPPELHNRPERIAPAMSELIGSWATATTRSPLPTPTAAATARSTMRSTAPASPGCRASTATTSSAATRSPTAMAEQPGTYFLTDFLARTFERTVWRSLGLDRHPELRDSYFHAYTRVIWLAQRRSAEMEAPRSAPPTSCSCRSRCARWANRGSSSSSSGWWPERAVTTPGARRTAARPGHPASGGRSGARSPGPG